MLRRLFSPPLSTDTGFRMSSPRKRNAPRKFRSSGTSAVGAAASTSSITGRSLVHASACSWEYQARATPVPWTTLPASGGSRPAMVLRSVLLPAPFTPTTTRRSPRPSSKPTSANTVRPA